MGESCLSLTSPVSLLPFFFVCVCVCCCCCCCGCYVSDHGDGVGWESGETLVVPLTVSISNYSKNVNRISRLRRYSLSIVGFDSRHHSAISQRETLSPVRWT